jgi:hypothetical protein
MTQKVENGKIASMIALRMLEMDGEARLLEASCKCGRCFYNLRCNAYPSAIKEIEYVT